MTAGIINKQILMSDKKLTKIKPESFGDFDKVSDEFLPNLSLNSDQVPELHNWEPGKNYRVTLEIRQDGKHVAPNSKVRGDFSIIAYGVEKVKNIDEMSDQEFAQFQGEELDRVAGSRDSSISIGLSDETNHQ